MKILYALQGTGNGHICRALEVVPSLKKYAQVDVLMSGHQTDLDLPFPIRYRHKGLSFVFGKKGGVDLWQTFQKANTRLLWQEIKRLPVDQYDVVINDFEPLTAWACHFRRKTCISLSHQSAVLAPEAPKPKRIDYKGYLTLKNYAPASQQFGFHFQPYNSTIFTPVIRQQIRETGSRKGEHITVYLPAYSEEKLVSVFSKLKDVQWEVFSKHSTRAATCGNVQIFPVQNDAFVESMLSSRGILCGAGFETPAEALFLGKKLMVIPMKNQFEQHCNAAALADLGVPVLKSLKKKHLNKIESWIHNEEAIKIEYPEQTDRIVQNVLLKAEDLLLQNIRTESTGWKELIASSFL